MINILYDHQKFSTQQYGGISRYFTNIIEAIKMSPDLSYQLGVVVSQNHYLKKEDEIFSFLKKLLKNPNHIYKLNKLYSNYLLSKDDFNIFHPTYYDTYFTKKLRKPLVVTIHDMTYERLPEYFWSKDPLTNYKRINVERADRVIAISETTKNDLVKYLNTDPAKIEVIHHGIDFKTPFITKSINTPENYLLFVGDRSGYKNFFLFINSFKEISLKYPDIKVILTGGGDLNIAEIEYIRRLKLTGRIIHINADDKELNYLYQQALIFVYPSLNEGFGLPVLEAFMAKCPIILSDTACFREIAKDAAVYFSPQSQDDLITAIEKVIIDTELQRKMVETGNKRLHDFPIDKSLESTFALYRELV